MTQEKKSRLRKAAPSLQSLTVEGFQALLQKLDLRRHAQETNGNGNVISMEEFLNRMQYVKMIVSLWSHACMVDGELAVQEELNVGEMMHNFFGSKDALFPRGVADQDVVFDELVEAFNAPVPLSEVIEYARMNEELTTVFFEEACCIVAADNILMEAEQAFIDRLGEGLGLPIEVLHNIKHKYVDGLTT